MFSQISIDTLVAALGSFSLRVGASIDASKTTLAAAYGININGGEGGKPGESAILIVQLRYLFASNISGLAILVCVLLFLPPGQKTWISRPPAPGPHYALLVQCSQTVWKPICSSWDSQSEIRNWNSHGHFFHFRQRTSTCLMYDQLLWKTTDLLSSPSVWSWYVRRFQNCFIHKCGCYNFRSFVLAKTESK